MNYQKLIETVAKRNKTTPKTVDWEMQKAIVAAFDESAPETLALLKGIPCQGERPTPKEFICAMVAMLL